MTGLTNFLQKLSGKGGPRKVRPDGVDEDGDDGDTPYPVKTTKPTAQMMVRVGLWGAVALGCLGGLLAMLGLTTREGDTIITEGGVEGGGVPAPVARVAERATELWLTSDVAEEPLVEALFVEPPERTQPGLEDGGLAVGEVTTVGGGLWEEGYWLVTLAVEVAECVPASDVGWLDADDVDEDGEPVDSGELTGLAASLDCPDAPESEGLGFNESEGDDEHGLTPEELGVDTGASGSGGAEEAEESEPRVPRATTWFVELGVAGELEHRVAVLTTPALVAPPAGVSPEWSSSGRNVEPPPSNEPMVQTVEQFLQAWQADGGDPTLHSAAGVEVEAVSPAPFSELVMTGYAFTQDEPGASEVRAHMVGTTPGGTAVEVAYELSLAFREDRWEVTGYWGAPPLASRPSGDGAADAEVGDEGGGNGADGADEDGDGDAEGSDAAQSGEG